MNNIFKTQKEFFKVYGNEEVTITYSDHDCSSFTIEEMYQHFKERLLSELNISEEYI